VIKAQTFFLSGRICRGNRATTAFVITVANLTTKSVVRATQRSTQSVMRSTMGHIRYRLHTHTHTHTHDHKYATVTQSTSHTTRERTIIKLVSYRNRHWVYRIESYRLLLHRGKPDISCITADSAAVNRSRYTEWSKDIRSPSHAMRARSLIRRRL